MGQLAKMLAQTRPGAEGRSLKETFRDAANKPEIRLALALVEVLQDTVERQHKDTVKRTGVATSTTWSEAEVRAFALGAHVLRDANVQLWTTFRTVLKDSWIKEWAGMDPNLTFEINPLTRDEIKALFGSAECEDGLFGLPGGDSTLDAFVEDLREEARRAGDRRASQGQFFRDPPAQQVAPTPPGGPPGSGKGSAYGRTAGAAGGGAGGGRARR
jgi:hypothetical protein